MEKLYFRTQIKRTKRRLFLADRAETGFAIPGPVLTLLAVFLFVFIAIPGIARASFIVDNFESYPIGSIISGNGWSASTANISDDYFNTGTRSLKLTQANGYAVYTPTNSTSTGSIGFRIYAVSGGETNFVLGDPDTGNYYQFRITQTSPSLFQICGAGTGIYSDGSCLYFSYETWTDFQISFSGGYIYYSIAGGEPVGPYLCPTNFMKATIYGNSAREFYFDDFVSEIPRAEYLTPIWPDDCVFNYSSSTSATATGSFFNPDDSGTAWTDMTIILNDFLMASTSATSTNYIFPSEILPGSTENYSFSFGIPRADLPYSVSYLVSGYMQNSSTTFNNYYWNCPGTFIGPLYPGSYGPTPVINPEYFEQADCSSYDWITNLGQRLFCELKNFTYSLFIPSRSSVEELKMNLEEAKTKYPINFLTATLDFLKETNSGMSENNYLTLRLFGRESSTTLSILDKEITYAGITLSVNEFIKLIIGFFLLAGFLLWAVVYARRIF
jgi:hypothetical protein